MTRKMTLDARLAAGQSDLVADLFLYPTDAGGRQGPISLGYGCPCSKDKSFVQAWDGYPLLETEMTPGETRRVGFVFLSGQEAVDDLMAAGMFYLWEGRFIGTATIVR